MVSRSFVRPVHSHLVGASSCDLSSTEGILLIVAQAPSCFADKPVMTPPSCPEARIKLSEPEKDGKLICQDTIQISISHRGMQ